ncbi:hypothetical protein GW17_00061549 [Ensete ventricosum]|nr:hypothetical protein GW17_00061549 [Ensete ventricosum]
MDEPLRWAQYLPYHSLPLPRYWSLGSTEFLKEELQGGLYRSRISGIIVEATSSFAGACLTIHATLCICSQPRSRAGGELELGLTHTSCTTVGVTSRCRHCCELKSWSLLKLSRTESSFELVRTKSPSRVGRD